MAETLEKKILLDIEIKGKTLGELKKDLKETKKDFDNAKVGSEAFTKSQSKIKELTQSVKVLNDSTKANSAAQKDLSKLLNAQKGSVDQLNAANNILRKRRNALNLSTEEGRVKLQRLNSAIDRNNKKIVESSDAMKKQRMNVGNYGSALNGLKGALATVGIGLVGIAGAFKGVTKVVGDLITSNQTLGDEWAKMMSGMSFAYDAFLSTLRNGDWSDFFTNMSEAYKAGAEFASMLDAIFELTNSFRILESEAAIELKQYETIYKDKTLADGVRLEAMENFKNKRKEILDEELELKKHELATYEKQAMQKTGLDKEELAAAVRNSQDTEKYRKAATLLNAQLSVATEEQKEILLKGYTKEAQQVAKLLRGYQEGTDNVIKPYVDAWVNLNTVQVKYVTDLQKVTIQENKLKEEIAKNTEVIKERGDAVERVEKKKTQAVEVNVGDRNKLFEFSVEQEASILNLSEDQYYDYLANRQNADEDYFEWVIRKNLETENAKIKEYKKTASQIQQISGITSNVVNNLMEVELINAGDNEQKKKEIQKKYADEQFIITSAGIVATTASAIIGALAPPPVGLGPVLGVPFSALAAIEGATQLAVTNAQRQQVKSLHTGGFTGDGIFNDSKVAGRKIAGVVHDNEFVASTKLINKYPSLFASLDSQQKGFADGGFTSRNISSEVLSNNYANLQLLEAIKYMPNPVVSVEDITKGVSNKVRVKQRATL